jgi:hypothetical protein
MHDDRVRIRIAAYLVTGIWSVGLLIAGVHLKGAWVKVLTAAPLVVVAVFAVFDNWLWQLAGVREVVRRPRLNGMWRGELTSMRDGGSGSETAHDPIPIFLAIRQTYLALSVVLLSAESKSRSIGAILQRHDNGDFSVYYHYDNVPMLEHRAGSPRHAGGARIAVPSLSPAALEGEYWTDRRTRGDFTVRKVSGKRYASWSEALEHLGVGTEASQ